MGFWWSLVRTQSPRFFFFNSTFIFHITLYGTVWSWGRLSGSDEKFLYPKHCNKCHRSPLKVKYGISVGYRRNNGESGFRYCIKCTPVVLKKIIVEHEKAHIKKIKKFMDLLHSIEAKS